MGLKPINPSAKELPLEELPLPVPHTVCITLLPGSKTVLRRWNTLGKEEVLTVPYDRHLEHPDGTRVPLPLTSGDALVAPFVGFNHSQNHDALVLGFVATTLTGDMLGVVTRRHCGTRFEDAYKAALLIGGITALEPNDLVYATMIVMPKHPERDATVAHVVSRIPKEHIERVRRLKRTGFDDYDKLVRRLQAISRLERSGAFTCPPRLNTAAPMLVTA